MKIAVTCKTHEDKPVVPVDLDTFIGLDGKLVQVGENWCSTEIVLHEGELYCTGGTGEHKFRYAITV